MGIPLHIVEKPFPEKPREAGMMWRWAPGEREGRECWWIILPQIHPDIGTPGHPGEVSWRTTDVESDPPHRMWDISGTPPSITVTPSIDVLRFVRHVEIVDGKEVVTHVREGSYWHGFITNGEIRDA